MKITKYKNKFLFYLSELYLGKSILRILLDSQMLDKFEKIEGKIVDFGCSSRPYYHEYIERGNSILKVDIEMGPGIDMQVNLEDNSLPMPDGSIDSILLVNVLELLKNPESLFLEFIRILKPDGKIFFSSLLTINLRPQPGDYNRWTELKIRLSLKEAGFKNIEIIPIGERFTVCTNLIISPIPLKGILGIIVKGPIYILALWLDRLIPKNILKNHPCPIGYFCIAQK